MRSQFLKRPLGVLSLFVLLLFVLMGVYAPLLAASKPLVIFYDDTLYFPLFRYLLYPGLYTKPIDLFFNLLIFTLPFFLIKKVGKYLFFAFQGGLFLWIFFTPHVDPAFDSRLSKERQEILQKSYKSRDASKLAYNRSFEFELEYFTPYQKLNKVTDALREQSHTEALKKYGVTANKLRESDESQSAWLESEKAKVTFVIWPLIRTYHWEEYVGGSQSQNQKLPFWELTRLNRKDFMAALIFGVRVSLVVGILAIGIALFIGLPLGAAAGYYGGKFDIYLCRIIEVWESMPTFFMLLFIVAVLQSKSIFMVISVIGLFGWMGFTRYMRGEFFKQRNLSYVEACRSLGYSNRRIMFKHILPNAIPPLLTLLPFAMMGAISSEAGLSFLGLGEEGSSSWGVLMDEGRNAFPGESYLLWPPAILLTILLISIALVGDTLRDAIDPKLHIE